MLPADWSTSAAQAFLVIAMAAVDGSFDVQEIDAIRPTLIRLGMSDEDAVAATRAALEHYRITLEEDTLEDALVGCAMQLKEELSKEDLRSLMTSLAATALADAEVHGGEHAFLRTIGTIWGLA